MCSGTEEARKAQATKNHANDAFNPV